jgi:hypothetical protein
MFYPQTPWEQLKFAVSVLWASVLDLLGLGRKYP